MIQEIKARLKRWYGRKKRIVPIGALHYFLFIFFLTGFSSVHAQTYPLHYYLEQGENNSPLLKDIQNQIRTGTMDSMLIKAAQRPQVLANGQILIAPTLHGFGYDPAVTNGGNYQAVIGVSQPIFTKKILAPQYEGIDLQNQTLGNTEKISKLGLLKDITAQYITAYADYQQFLSNQEVYQLLQTQQDILKRLVQNAIYKETDYLNFQVALQSQEITMDQLQIQYKTDISILNYLCGIHDTSAVLLSEPDLAETGYISKPNSVFFKQFILDSLKIINNKELIDTKYRPSVNWFADAGLLSSQPATLYKTWGAELGLNLSMPIYDGHRRKIEYQKLKIAENTRQDYSSFFNLQYNQQRAMLLQQLEESEKLSLKIKEKLSTAQMLIDMDRKQLNTGDVRITDYIIAINNYLNIKNNLNQVNINRWHILNQLNYWNH